VPGQQQCERDEEIGWGHKEMTYDTSQNDARGTRASYYAQTTTRAYLQTVEDFARYFQRPPD